jgi:hypothetical protein
VPHDASLAFVRALCILAPFHSGRVS